MSADLPPDRNAARSEATRGALVRAARELFAERGYAAVGTEEVVRAAGVTRGALYHHFGGKQALFLAVVEAIEGEMVAGVGAQLGAVDDVWEGLLRGLDLWLDACLQRDVQRIVLLDAPAVLGHDGWRAVEEAYGLGLLRAAIGAAMDADLLARRPVEPLARVLLGAMAEAALVVARSDDPAAARAEVGALLRELLEGLRR